MLNASFQTILREAKEAILKALQTEEPLSAIDELRVKLLGKKGTITELLKQLGTLAPQDRPEAGKQINDLKREIEEALSSAFVQAKRSAQEVSLKKAGLDVTLPGLVPFTGCRHPLSRVEEEILSIFTRFGFSIVRGPEVETDYYNFEALNIPKDHPARDMQDTIYMGEDLLLRTHTSPVQIRVMEKIKPPLRILCPGAVYRHDFDASHSPMFHQIEGLLVDEEVTFGDLKGILSHFAKSYFGESGVRFRPSYFQFTEPSAEMDIACVICHGKGCPVCKYSGWMEILGCGMVDPAVFSYVKYDSERFQGFAFGMGIERIAMLKYGIPDIRLFFENDVRFLRQFR